MGELHDLSATEQVAALRRGDFTPREAAQHYLGRIARLDPAVGAFVTITAEAALERAEALEQDAGRSAVLWGLPHADKDLVARAGVRTTYGSRLTESFVPEVSDPLIDVLDAAGAVSLGKTNTPEFGLPSYTENLVSAPSRTPWDLTRGAGGSSGGAAAAVATGLLPAAVGSDGGGSIRIPSAACGLVGLKPSRGRVPSLGGFGMLAGLPTAGPIARTVEDAGLLLDALVAAPPRTGATAGSDLGAAWATVPPTWDGGQYLGAAVRGEGRFQLAVSTDSPWRSHYDIEVGPDARAALELAIAELSAIGHGIEELRIPETPDFAPAFRTIWQSGAAGIPAEGDALQLLEPLTQWLVEVGRSVSARELGEALAQLARFERDTIARFAPYDAVLMPTLAVLPPAVGWYDQSDGERNFAQQVQVTPFTSFVNASGLPAIQLPVHWTDGGLPMGVQLIGRPGGEHVLLAIGAQLQRRLRWQDRRPSIW
jgi:amidase